MKIIPGWLTQWFEARGQAKDNGAYTLEERGQIQDDDAGAYALVGGPTHAGPPVSEESALRYSAVWACVRILSESIASLPLILFEQQGRNKTRAVKHALYAILHSLVNPHMTSFDWRETAIGHVASWGNHWSEIEFDDYSGQVKALWPLRPDRMEKYKRLEDGSAWWGYRLPGGDLVWLPAYRVHHIRGYSTDGVWGMSPIRVAGRQATGLGLGMEEYGSRFFSNNARPGGMLKHPGKLSTKAYERLQTDFNEAHQGLSNAHRLRILEEGMDFVAVGIPNNEAQFLESRKFQVTEIARIFRVPPHMLADLERATFSNIEHQSLNFVTYTLMPYLVRHEQAIHRDLLMGKERERYFAKYVVAGLLRGDLQTRYQAYNVGIQSGFMTRNEARELEDWNPIDGLDEPLVPLNMGEAGAALPTLPTRGEARPGQWRPLPRMEERAIRVASKRRQMMQRTVRLFEDATDRATKREVADIRRALKSFLGKRSVAEFENWLGRFYEDLRGWLPDYYRALMEMYAEQVMAAVADELDGEPAPLDDDLRSWITEYLDNFAAVYAVGGEKQLRTLIAEAESNEDVEAAINERLDGWEENRASKTALDQAFEAGNALAIFGYTVAGVAELVWRGGDCPLCAKFNGRKIPINGAFADEGDTIEADGVDPFPVVRRIKHGPLHNGCDCVAMAT